MDKSIKSLAETMYFLLKAECNYAGIEFDKFLPIEVKDTNNFYEIASNALTDMFDCNVGIEHDYFEVTFDNEVTASLSWKQITKADYITIVRYIK